MSHVATVEITIEDIGALKAACAKNGWTFLEGKKTYRWYGRWVNDYHGSNAAYKHGIPPSEYGKCEHAIRVSDKKGAYEIGVARNQDGNLVLIWDFYGGEIEKACGKDCDKLFEAYNEEVTIKKMKSMGYVYEGKETTKQGEPELIFLGG